MQQDAIYLGISAESKGDGSLINKSIVLRILELNKEQQSITFELEGKPAVKQENRKRWGEIQAELIAIENNYEEYLKMKGKRSDV